MQAGSPSGKNAGVDALIALAADAKALTCPEPHVAPDAENEARGGARGTKLFAFFYKANLSLLEKLAELLYFFSDIRRSTTARGQGILLPGGYPELYAKALSENGAMRDSVAKAVRAGMPCLAECGGFLYLAP